MVPIDPVKIATSSQGGVTGVIPTGSGPDVIGPDAAPKFQAMMKNLEDQSRSVGPTDGRNLLGDILSERQDSARARDSEMAAFIHDGPNMSQAEMAAREMHLNREIAVDSARMSITTGMAEGLNKGLQTLLKPQ